MVNIAIMGDYDSIYGFKALGVKVCPVTDPLEAEQMLKKLAEEKTAVIYRLWHPGSRRPWPCMTEACCRR